MLEEWMSAGWSQVAFIGLSALAMYVALVTLTRIAGLRSFSKMSGFDFAVTVAIGSVLASVVVAKDPPVANGVAALVALFVIQIGFAALRSRFGILKTLADNKPRLIMIGEEIQHDQLKKAKMTESDLMAKLREANVFQFSQILAVVAETTGDVSVLHAQGHGQNIMPEILEGVIKKDRYFEKLAA